MKNLLGDKFFFLSGCEHYFCFECLKQEVIYKINNGQVSQIFCPDAGCRKNLNDLDIQSLNLDRTLLEKYEQFSLSNAIAQMDDLGYCPIVGCGSLGSLATIERDKGFGKCQFCDFMFCLECKERYHPYKRCMVYRLDLFDMIDATDKVDIQN